ncbi:MAG: hypothetical protein PHW50_02165 [Patescibacteria group bacterium]|nr:hypothetical protein [Patescibacteria group bacterium]
MTAQEKQIREKINQEELEVILNGITSDNNYQYVKGRIFAPYAYKVLGQPRKTFEQIEELANDIARHRQLQSIIVARFTKTYALEYIRMNNELWGLKNRLPVKPSFVDSDGVNYYDILIAGERRTRAIRYLFDHGCADCLDKYGREKPGTCYQRHPIGQDGIDVSFAINIPPAAAINIQFSENIHNGVPTDEEARGHQVWFRFLKKRYGNQITLKLFSECVGRNPNSISDSVHFCQLPDQIQQDVAAYRMGKIKVKITYGFALQVARLQRAFNLDNEQVIREYRKLIESKFNDNISVCRAHVSERIAQSKSGQGDLFFLMSEAQKKNFDIDNHLQIFQNSSLPGLRSLIAYLHAVAHVYVSGEINLFSSKEIIDIYCKVVDAMADLYPLIVDQLPKEKQVVVLEEIAKTKIAIQRLNKHFISKGSL